MGKCGACGKSKDTPNTCTVYTARVLGQTAKKTGFKEQTITTYHGDFQEHTYQVCNSCFKTRGCILPAAAYLISVPLLTILLGISYSVSSLETVVYVCGGLFFAFLPMGAVALLLSVDRALVRKALAVRRSASSRDKYKGYTSAQYKALSKH